MTTRTFWDRSHKDSFRKLIIPIAARSSILSLNICRLGQHRIYRSAYGSLQGLRFRVFGSRHKKILEASLQIYLPQVRWSPCKDHCPFKRGYLSVPCQFGLGTLHSKAQTLKFPEPCTEKKVLATPTLEIGNTKPIACLPGTFFQGVGLPNPLIIDLHPSPPHPNLDAWGRLTQVVNPKPLNPKPLTPLIPKPLSP